eukprot:626894_1
MGGVYSLRRILALVMGGVYSLRRILLSALILYRTSHYVVTGCDQCELHAVCFQSPSLLDAVCFFTLRFDINTSDIVCTFILCAMCQISNWFVDLPGCMFVMHMARICSPFRILLSVYIPSDYDATVCDQFNA